MTDAAVNHDGYENLLTSVGTAMDPTAQGMFRPDAILTEPELEALFRHDGIGRRVVSRPAFDMNREWFTLDGGNGEATLDKLEVLRAQQRFIEATTWSRLYGGALMVAVTDRASEDFSTPLRPGAGTVVGLRVFAKPQVQFDLQRPSRDSLRRLDGFPEFYRVTPVGGGYSNTKPFDVHESRCAIFRGLPIPDNLRANQNGWDDSILQAAYAALMRLGTSQGYTANIVKEFSQSVLSVKGLTGLLAGGKEDVVRRRLALLDMSKSILNTMMIDADGEVYTRNSSAVAGLADLLDRFSEYLAAIVDMPLTLLLGRSPAGMNSTGESDMRNYYDFVASEQRRVLTPPAEWLVALLNGNGQPWSIKWNKLKQPTAKEEAELRKLVGDNDKTYIEQGVLSAEEVAQSRFGSGAWSAETRLIAGTERSAYASEAEPPVTETPGAAGATNEDAAPQPLYVSRKLVNVAELAAWAKSAGVELDQSQPLHVTICYSKADVDWMGMGTPSWEQDEKGRLTVAPGGPRMVDSFGPEGKSTVLLFASNALTWRHKEFLDAGASHDWGDYQPHITLNNAGGLPAAGSKPYLGKLVFGPEEFEPLEV